MSYEQAPAYFPETPKDGKKRIFIDKVFEKPRDKDMQMMRLKRVGYESDKKYSNDDVDCLMIDEKVIEKRQKDREVKTTRDLLQTQRAGIEGEQDDLSFTRRKKVTPEEFFGGDEEV